MGVHLGFCSILLLWLIQAAAVSKEAGKSSCSNTCGNVSIPYPFGFEPGCYTNSWFRVTCNKTDDGLKPYISRINLELLRWNWLGEAGTMGGVTVNSPVTYVNCGNSKDHDGAASSFNLTGSPFVFSIMSNVFGSVGCGNLVTIFRNQNDSISGILQPRCGEQTAEGGSYAQMYENMTFYTETKLTSYTATLTKIYRRNYMDNKRCRSSVFMFDKNMLDLDLAFPNDININTKHVPATLEWSSFECDLGATLCQEPGAEPYNSLCIERCGEVNITYPFGIKAGCYMNDWFRVTCKQTADGPKPFISTRSNDLQVFSFSFMLGSVTIKNSVTYFNCPNKDDKDGVTINLTGSPFFLSNIFNRFVSIGCGNLATIFHNRNDVYSIGGCLQPRCRDVATSNGGCLMTIPPGLISFVANMTEIYPNIGSNRSCGSAVMIESNSLGKETIFLDPTHVPTVLEWGAPKSGLCELDEGLKIFCSPDGEYCWTNLSSTHLCVCYNDMRGSFAVDVCQEAGKCGHPKYKYCYMLCLNTPGNYCSSPCPDGYEYVSTENTCKPIESPAKKHRDWSIIVAGCSTSIGTLFVLLGTWRMYKVLKRRKNIKLKQKYFKRNGGLLLRQQLSADEGNVEKIRLFTSKELEKATDYYNENRILGQGGQGTVYKGMLTDGSIVAIKKPKMEETILDENKLQQFINEVIILSQINHRNVVKLLGCCLETKVPLLVYEFVPNGTLSQLIHDPNEEFPLTWEMRFRIAAEIGNALSYLHSAASIPIYHRDIKSSNILLDDKYRAKVSDFGTSRSIALEQTHLTTRVQGTFGYMDPEYFRSSRFTEKSDVYSFGVVLVELLTGQKPISLIQSEEVRSVVSFFLNSMKENSLFDILDPRVVNYGPQKKIMAFAKLAKRCLNLNGKRRPTMKQVAMELEWIRALEEANAVQQSDDEDSDIDDMIEPWTMVSCSTRSTINNSVTLSLDA